MNSLTAARAQMEVSFAFHIIFAALGIGLPLLMVIAEGLGLKTKEPHYFTLARTWAKATALLFVVGAVSGTALSFELGLLWPTFMALAGPLIGPAFALEGYAFFLEAIFLGLYLYGWERLSPRAHWLSGWVVAIAGTLSGVVVLATNAWMQSPSGFTSVVNGHPVGVDALAVFRNALWLPMAAHSTLSCFIAVGFAVAGIYARGLIRGRHDAVNRSAVSIALAVGAVAAVLQLLSGDRIAKMVFRTQPAKGAAMEALFETETGAPLLIGGIPDAARGEVRGALRIPHGLSFLASGDLNSSVRGLNSFPADERPNVLICHVAFQIMVGCGTALVAIALIYWLVRWRRPSWCLDRRLLIPVVLASPLGFIALEAGWFLTEIGRQPWSVHGVLRTRDSVTSAGPLTPTFFLFSFLYTGLAVALIVLLRSLARAPQDAHSSPPIPEAIDGVS